MGITLGTATFGSDYGVANRGRVLQSEECAEILDASNTFGIQSLDTAPDYGDSEKIIGQFNGTNPKFKVYTKISGSVEISIESIKSSISQSLKNLNCKALEGIYFHSPEMLINSDKKAVKEVISWILENEITEKIGISVYEENQIARITEVYPELNLFQVPENILDRRLLESKIVKQLKTNGCEINIRSVFLQGLLLMSQNEIPLHLKKAHQQISRLKDLANSHHITLESLCLNYAQSIDWASNVIIGVHSKAQLMKILQYSDTKIDFRELPAPLTDEILDPRRWAHS